MAEFALRLVICLAWVTIFVQSFQVFQSLIPNGNKVPNPCSNGSSIYEPVGHKSSNIEKASKETLNRFGQDFNATGRNWTLALCKMDSDGDGKSNGVELGDPNCKWVNDRNSTLLPPTGHPGIKNARHVYRTKKFLRVLNVMATIASRLEIKTIYN